MDRSDLPGYNIYDMATRLIKRAAYFKRCEKCNEEKPTSEFKSKSFYVERKRYFVREETCLECNIVDDPNDTKRCHNCSKHKPISEFRKFIIGTINLNQIVEANNCKVCEAAGARERKYVDNIKITIDPMKVDFYCAFIGKASYKQICKIYKIRQTEHTDKRSYKLYKQRAKLLEKLKDRING